MESKPEKYLEELERFYEPSADFDPEKLVKIAHLARELSETRDPVMMAFRENEHTQKLISVAVSVYRASCVKLLEDNGELPREERIRYHMSRIWAQWFIRAMGEDPEIARKKVEQDIEEMAKAAGIF